MELTNDFEVSAPVGDAWAILTDVERIAPCLPGAQLQEVEGDEYRGIVKVKVGPITAQFKGAARFVEQDEAAHRAVLRAEGRDTGGKGNANATITAQLEPADSGGTHVTISTDLNITGRVAQFGRGALADVSTKLLRQFVDSLEATVLRGDGAAASSAGGTAGVDGVVETVAAGSGEAPPEDRTSLGAPAAAAGADPAARVDVPVSPTGDVMSDAEPPPAAEGTDTAPSPGPEAPTVRRIEGPAAEPVDLLDAAGGTLAKRLLPVGIVVLVVAVVLRRLGRRRKS
ncbi:MAG: SRPBCC family protein [Actinobacteria bacterium]|nr:SRPBCC family protein [Actinomycetota bacterium]